MEALEDRYAPAVNVLSFHNDLASTGVNANETVLTPSNVNVNSFGKLFTTNLDGQVYAQPLVVTNVSITAGPNGTASGVHDVVYAATEHDSIYAIDSADGSVLWKRSFIDITPGYIGGTPGTNVNNPLAATAVSTVPPAILGTNDISVEVGITGTPVIDPNSSTLFVVARTAETIAGATHWVQRLHAIDLADGTDRLAPYSIGDTSSGNNNNDNNTAIYCYGTGDGSVVDPYNGTGLNVVQFNALREHQRMALSFVGGQVYCSWASHGDTGPYHGWVVKWDVTPAGFALAGVLNTSPNEGLAGIWQSGGKLSFESDGSAFYFETGNGYGGAPTVFDANGLPVDGNYNEALVKVVNDPTSGPTNQNVNGWGMKVTDFFMPYNVLALDGADSDFGSGAPLVLPDSAGIPGHPHLLLAAGKEGKIYVVDRDAMGKYDAANDNVINAVSDGAGHVTPPAHAVAGLFSTPVYFNGQIYAVGAFGPARSFAMNSDGSLSVTSQTAVNMFGYLPGSLAVSANGTLNGIVWAMDRQANVIRAYDANTFSTQLWSSGLAVGGVDNLGAVVKFAVPTVANGQVFVGTSNSLVVYGLKQAPTAPPSAPVVTATALSGSSINLTWTDGSAPPNTATSYAIEESIDGGLTFGAITTAPAGSTSIAVGGLAPLTEYQFRIRGLNGAGASAYSNSATASTTSLITGLDFASGFADPAAALTLNSSATVNGAALRLTDGGVDQAGSAFSTTPLDITGFASQFTFQTTAGAGTGEGLTFAIQGVSANAIGGNGGALGYGPAASGGNAGIAHSVAVKFDLIDTNGEGANSTGLYLGGAAPTNVGSVNLASAGIDFHSGHVFQVNVTYLETALTVVIKDLTTNATATQTYSVDVPAAVGGTTAHVGLTASTGAVATATQDVLTWTYAPTAAASPNTPSGLGATAASATTVSLHWTNNAANQTSFNLDRADDPGFTQNLITQNLPASPTTFVDGATGLAPGNVYYYRIRAFNSAGSSGNSNVASVTIPLAPPTPTNQMVDAVTKNSIAISWTDNAGHQNDGYQILRSVNHGVMTLIATLPLTSRTPPSRYEWVDENLTPGTTYEYHIIAQNVAGHNDFAGVNATTLLDEPKLNAVVPSAGAQTLLFSGVPGATSYNVYRGASSGTETLLAQNVVASPYVDSDVEEGVQYFYYVTAVNAAVPNESAPSNEAFSIVAGATFQWTGNGADANWTTAANWLGGVAPTGRAFDTLIFPAGAARLASIDDLPVGSNFFAGIVVEGAGFSILTQRVLTLGSGGIDLGQAATLTVSAAVDSGLALAASATFDVAAGATLVVAAQLDEATYVLSVSGAGDAAFDAAIDGSGGLVVASQGTVALNAANGYTGPTTISSGTVDAGDDDALGVSSDVTVAQGATLNVPRQSVAGLAGTYYSTKPTFPDSSYFDSVAHLQTYLAGVPVVAHDRTTTPNGRNQDGATFDYGADGAGFTAAIGNANYQFAAVWSGQFEAQTAGTYVFETGSNSGSMLFVDGAAVVSSRDYHYSVLVSSGSVDLTHGFHDIVIAFFVDLANPGLFVNVQTPGGSLQRLSNSLLSEPTPIDLHVGTLAGSGTVSLQNNRLTVGSERSSVFAGVVSGNDEGGLTKVGAGTIVLVQPQYAGSTAIVSGTLQFGDGVVPLTSASTSSIANQGTLVVANPAATTLSLDQPMSGNGGLTVLGGTAELGAGTTAIGGVVTVAAGATLNVDAAANSQVAFGALAGAGTVAFVNSNIGLTVGGNNLTTAFGGVLAGDLSLTKLGTGVWTVSGSNGHSGTTTIGGGVLIAANDSALGSTAAGTVVLPGGTLAFSDGVTIAEPITASGTGAAGWPGAIANSSGANLLTGAIVSQGSAAVPLGVGASAGTLTIAGDVALRNSSLVVAGAGSVIVDGDVGGYGFATTSGLAQSWLHSNDPVGLLDGIGAGQGNGGMLTAVKEGTGVLSGPLLFFYNDFGPATGGSSADNLKMLWQGQLVVLQGADYRFSGDYIDDDITVYVDRNRDHTFKTSDGENVFRFSCCNASIPYVENTFHLDPGNYDIAIGYSNGGGGRSVGVRFSVDGGATFQRVVPGAGVVANTAFLLPAQTNALIKNGSGSLILNGDASFSVVTGTTAATVAGGSLLVNGALTVNAPLTTATGASIGGTGSVAGAVTIASGGVLAPGGQNVGVFSVQSAAFSAGAQFDVRIGGASIGSYDRLVASGSVDVSAAILDLSLVNYVPAAGDAYGIVAAGGTLSGTFANVTNPNDVPIAGLPSDLFAKLVYGVSSVTIQILSRVPTIADGAAIDVSRPENSTAVTTVVGSDLDSAALIYSIAGGADAGFFQIGAATGVLTFVAAPDFESPENAAGDNVYVVTVQVSDGTFAALQTIHVTVTNVNEAPTITSNGGGSTANVNVPENTTAVATVTATDADAGTTLTFSIAGGDDASLFSVDSVTGALTFLAAPNFEAPVDADNDNVYLVDVQVSDGSLTATQSFHVTVTNVNEAPTISSNGGGSTANVNVSENTTAVAIVTATDPDAGTTLTFSIAGGADAGFFHVDPDTGALTFVAAPDFESPANVAGDNVYVVAVQVSDGSLTATQTFHVTVTDVNEAPTITSNGGGSTANVNVPENATAVAIMTATDVDAGTTLTFSIAGGDDASLFSVDSVTGALTFLAAPNFEAPVDADNDNVYVVAVQVSDGSLTATQSFHVTVTNVNEAPTITSNGGGSSANVNVPENTAAVTTVTATDPDAGATLTFAIVGGADAASFHVDEATGILTFLAAPNYEAPTDANADNVYDVVVRVSDGSLTSSQALHVSVVNVNEAPAITSDGAGGTAAISMPENSVDVTSVAATDPDAGTTLTFSILGGDDAGLFQIDSATGALTFVAPPNFEAPADANGDNVYLVVVQVSDGALAASQAIAVTVVNVAESLTIVSNGGGPTAAIDVAENGTAVTTVVAVDEIPQPLVFAIVGGVDAARFHVDSATGALTFVAAPDFETPLDSDADNVYQVIVQATDGILVATQTIDVHVVNVNEPPTITSHGGAAMVDLGIPENTTGVTTVTAADPDAGTTLAFTLVGGADAGLFHVDPSTGALTFLAAPNFEAPADANADSVYDVVVLVCDGSLTATQTFHVTVTNVNEPPTITSNGGGANASVSVPENTTAVTAVAAIDPDAGTTLTFSLAGADANLFHVDASTGALTFLAAPNFEAPADADADNVYVVTVQVSDGVNLTAQTIQVTVTNVNEPPAFTSHGGAAAVDLGVAENTTAVTTVTAADPDANASLTLSIIGGADASLFHFDSATGALTFLAAPNFEAPADADADNVYDVVVQVSDGSLTATQTFHVAVTNVNEPPVITSNGGSATANLSVPENTTAVTTVTASDPDAGTTFTYAIVGGADAAKFAIDAAGALTFVTAPNFEAPTDVGANNVYDVIVQVSDGNATVSQAIAVTVTNVAETFTWSGAGGNANWSTAANWLGNRVPDVGESISFNSASSGVLNANNDLVGFVVKTIAIVDDAAGNFALTGNSISLTGGITNAGSSAATIVSMPLVLAGPATIANASPSPLTVNSTIATAGNALTVNGSAPVTLAGIVSGAGSLVMAGSSIVDLAANNTYTGTTTISSGVLRLAASKPLLTTASVAVAAPGILRLNGFSSAIKALTGAGTVENDSNSPATLTLGSNGAGGTFDGVLQDGDAAGSLKVVKTGANTQALNGTNTYTGGTVVSNGTLQASGDAGFGDPSATVTVSAPGKIAFSAPTTSSRPFDMNGNGTLQLNSGAILTLAGAGVFGGYVVGPGSIASSDTTYSGTKLRSSVTLQSGGGDVFSNVSNAGILTILSGHDATLDGLTNETGSQLSIAGTASANDLIDYGQMTVAGTLTNAGSSSFALGAGSVTTISATGFIDLSGADAHVSGLVTNYGTLGSATNSVVVDFGGRVQGPGTFHSVVAQNGGVYSPGNSPGGALLDTFAINGGGTFDFEIANAAGTAGNLDGWDMATVAPTVFSPASAKIQITATPASKYTIQLTSRLANGTTSGPAANFNPGQNYAWKFIDGSHPLTSVVGTFDPAAFSIVTSGFQNAAAGTFSVELRDGGKNLYIVYTAPVAVPTVASVAPFIGPTSGGNVVVIVGTNFGAATAVKFGAVGALSFTINSATQITAVAPAGSSTVDVSVVNGSGVSATSATADDYSYALPAVQSVVVNGGAIVARDRLGQTPAIANQSSVVEQILVTFNMQVTLDAGAFSIASLPNVVTALGIAPSNSAIDVTATGVASSQVPGSTGYAQYVLTFTGAGVNAFDNAATDGLGNSFTTLPDGFYQLSTIGAKVHAGASNTAADRADSFWSLFGAVNAKDVVASSPAGDGNDTLLVDGLALNDVYTAFGSTVGSPEYAPAFDWNLDGHVDGIDLSHLYLNFGTIWRF